MCCWYKEIAPFILHWQILFYTQNLAYTHTHTQEDEISIASFLVKENDYEEKVNEM